jgi:hypothetical protein
LIEKEVVVNKNENDVLMDLYVQQKLKEIHSEEPKVKDDIRNTADEVMKIQRKFL